MREEATRRKNLTRAEVTYAQLIEEAWILYEREKGDHPEGLFIAKSYRPENEKWHDQLETILDSKVDLISEAIQKNLVGFEEAVTAIRSLWDMGGPPNDQERELIGTVLKILRTEEGRAVRRDLLLALLGSRDPAPKATKVKTKKTR